MAHSILLMPSLGRLKFCLHPSKDALIPSYFPYLLNCQHYIHAGTMICCVCMCMYMYACISIVWKSYTHPPHSLFCFILVCHSGPCDF